MIRALWLRRRQAYRLLMLGAGAELNDHAKLVMADLRRFCHATDTTFVPGDQYQSALREGRRQVFNRICSYLNVTEQQIYQLTEDMEGETDDR